MVIEAGAVLPITTTRLMYSTVSNNIAVTSRLVLLLLFAYPRNEEDSFPSIGDGQGPGCRQLIWKTLFAARRTSMWPSRDTEPIENAAKSQTFLSIQEMLQKIR